MNKKLACLVAGAVLMGSVVSACADTFSDNFDDKNFTLNNWYSPVGNQTNDWIFSPNPNQPTNYRYYGHTWTGGADTAIALNNQYSTNELKITSKFGYFPWTGGINTDHHSVDFFFGANNLTANGGDGYFASIEWLYSSNDKSTDYFSLRAGTIGANNSSSTSVPFSIAVNNNHWMILDILVNTGTFDVDLFIMDPSTLTKGSSLASLDGINLQLGQIDGELGVHTKNGDTVILGLYSVDGQRVNPVPEPATMLLFGTGIAGLAAVGRRKRS